jgi:hypothetical protein
VPTDPFSAIFGRARGHVLTREQSYAYCYDRTGTLFWLTPGNALELRYINFTSADATFDPARSHLLNFDIQDPALSATDRCIQALLAEVAGEHETAAWARSEAQRLLSTLAKDVSAVWEFAGPVARTNLCVIRLDGGLQSVL